MVDTPITLYATNPIPARDYAAEIARLQEQVEAVTRERDEAKRLGHESFKLAVAHQDRAEASEARAARLEALAERVCWFDWSDNDEDAVRAVSDLRAALDVKEAG